MTKIPFWRTVGDAYSFTFDDWGRLFRAAGAWIALMVVVSLLMIALYGSDPEAMRASLLKGNIEWGAALLLILSGLLRLAGQIAVAVTWHRAVLLNETPPPIGTLRFRRREWRFLFYSIGVGLVFVLTLWVVIAVIAAIAIVLVSGSNALASFTVGPRALSVGGPLALAALLVLLPLAARFSLGLPAIAIEEPKGVLRRSWHRGRHNGWRLILGPIVCALPLNLASVIASGGQTAMGFVMAWGGAWFGVGLVLRIAFLVLANAATFLALAAAVSFLSLGFRFLTRGEAPPDMVPTAR